MLPLTRSQHIWHTARHYVHETTASWPAYAADVRAIYERRTPECRRLITWNSSRDAYSRMRADAAILRRFDYDYEHSTHDTDLPADLEEAMVLALPEDWQKPLLSILAARYGLLAAPIPQQASPLSGIGSLVREVGQAIHAITESATDGTYNEDEMNNVVHEIREAMAELTSWQHRICTMLQARGLHVVK